MRIFKVTWHFASAFSKAEGILSCVVCACVCIISFSKTDAVRKRCMQMNVGLVYGELDMSSFNIFYGILPNSKEQRDGDLRSHF